MEAEVQSTSRENGVESFPDPEEELPEMVVYSHSPLFYWWPVWVTGSIMAVVTYLEGTKVETGALSEFVHPNDALGIIYLAVLMLVIVFTNFSFRGVASIMAVGVVLFLAVLFAWLEWWNVVFRGIAHLSIHMNFGFYLWTSILLFALWAYATFVHIRIQYFRVRPGLISRVRLIGEGERNYDSRGAVLQKRREDLFRNWLLGLGSGDIEVSTSGARSDELILRDVLFVDRKLARMRKLVAIQVDQVLEQAPGS